MQHENKSLRPGRYSPGGRSPFAEDYQGTKRLVQYSCAGFFAGIAAVAVSYIPAVGEVETLEGLVRAAGMTVSGVFSLPGLFFGMDLYNHPYRKEKAQDR